MAEHSHGGHRQRVKERYLKSGLDAFAPHEIVEFLLFFGIPQRDTNPLAHRLIDTFGSVREILNADREMLLRVEGMTPHAATLLSLVGDVRRYCAQEETPLRTVAASTEEQVRFLKPRYEDLSYEEVWMLSLDLLSRVVGVHKISSGTPVTADVNIREVLRHALADNAVSVVFSHNHPSGIAVPSKSDIDTTVVLANTLSAAGIKLADHLVFARGGDCVSFKQTSALRKTLTGDPNYKMF